VRSDLIEERGRSLWVFEGDRLIDCRITCQVTPDQYQVIDACALFNLKPEIRGTAPTAGFHSDIPIEIVASLKPDRLPDLAAHAASAEAVAHYLSKLNEEDLKHPLFNTESWLGLLVVQYQTSGNVGYKTLWATLNPVALAAGILSEAEISEGLT